jgi:DNA-binding transcriptional MerR regulator
MEIRELAKRTSVPAKTIRYYEEIELLPTPKRKPNGYREYTEVDVNRLKLVAGARRLDISLPEVKEILDLRDHNVAPCGVMLELLEQKADEISRRIVELQQMQEDLQQLYSLGATFPTDDVDGKNCICHLVSQHAI